MVARIIAFVLADLFWSKAWSGSCVVAGAGLRRAHRMMRRAMAADSKAVAAVLLSRLVDSMKISMLT